MGYKPSVYKVKGTPHTFTYIPQPEDYGVLSYPTSFGHEQIDIGYFFHRHDFDFYMINYTVSGTGTLVYEGKTHKLKKGSLCFIYLGKESIYYPSSDDLEIYFFHVNGPQIKKFYKKITEDGNYVLENFPREIIEKAFIDLQKGVIENKSYFEGSKVINSLLTDALEFSLKRKTEPYPKLVFQIILALRDGDNITISDIANQVGYNPIYLERIYKKHTGETLKHAISMRNMERAENLLLTTDLSISEIAERLGYANSNGFITFFKKNMGLTPLEFRKQKILPH